MCEVELTLMISYGKDFGPSTVDQDEMHEVREEEDSAEHVSDPETADEDNEDTRSFRTNSLEEDVFFMQMLNRPQYESRIEEASHHPQSLSRY